ncbi:MAG: M12 family metallo-peptidase [Chloroflexia bacterium]
MNRCQPRGRSAQIIALLLLVMGLLTGADGADAGLPTLEQGSAGLFQASGRQGILPPGYPASILRSRFVTVDLSSFSTPSDPLAERLLLNLFDDVVLKAVRSDAKPNYGGITWQGKIEGMPHSQVTLTVGGGIMIGNISLPDATYQVRYAGDGVHAVYDVDIAISPPYTEPVVPTDLPVESTTPTLKTYTDPIEIDVMIVWTPAARVAVGGTAAIINHINLAVAETNTAYTNSLINQRIRLVFATEVVYTESGAYATDLARLRSLNDGYMDEVHALRNQYGADMVSLLFNDNSVCGVAYLMTTPSPAFESSAFSAVFWSCATGNYSFAHELGHNMGSHHDRANAPQQGSYPYSYGYQNPTCTPAFRTIMAYNCPAPGCARRQYFSNPNVLYNGCPTGVDENAPNSAHNALSMNNTAPIVAAWRSGPAATQTPTVTGTPHTATSTGTPTATPCVGPPIVVQGAIEAGDPTQAQRLFRDEPASTCQAPQSCSVSGNSNRFDAYTYTNGAASARCVTVEINSQSCVGAQFIHSTAYLGAFDPTLTCANYLADIGASPNPVGSYSFIVPAGTTFVVVVNEVVSNAGCPAYTITISGLGDCSTPSPLPTHTATTTPSHSATSTSILTSTALPISTTTATSTGSPTMSVVPTVCPIQFSDVERDNTFYPFIRCLACQGILGGYSDGTFRPNNDVTRGQLSKIVSSAAGFNGPPGEQRFEDVPPDSTFFVWIDALASRSYISGYPCGAPAEPCGVGNKPYFRPNANATRGQISKIVANAANINNPPGEQIFEDVRPGNTFYEWVQRLANLGVMSGYVCSSPGEPCLPGGRAYFRPNSNATRGQTAKIVSNTFFPSCDTQSRP